MVLAQKPDTVICTNDTDEEVLNNITITPEIYGLRSGDSISNLNYTYSVDQTSVTSSLIDNYTISIAPENADDCYKYEVIPVGGTLPITRESCSQPEPTTIPIIISPDNIEVCDGTTIDPSTLSYSTDPELQSESDVITNTEMSVSGNTISFTSTPTIESANPTEYTYSVSTGTGTVTRKDCAVTIPITFTPISETICSGDTPILSYTYTPELQEGDTISNDELEVVGTTIRFKQTPEVDSGDIYSRKYEVHTETGTLTIQNCLTINPECPDVCIPSESQNINIQTIEDIISNETYSDKNRGLNINSELKTQDTIKSVKFNTIVTEN